MLAHQLVVQRTQRPREIVLCHDRLVRHGHAVLPQLTQQNIQTFGGKIRRARASAAPAPPRCPRTARKPARPSAKPTVCAKSAAAMFSDARTHADQNGLSPAAHARRPPDRNTARFHANFAMQFTSIFIEMELFISLLAYSILLLYSFCQERLTRMVSSCYPLVSLN